MKFIGEVQPLYYPMRNNHGEEHDGEERSIVKKQEPRKNSLSGKIRKETENMGFFNNRWSN